MLGKPKIRVTKRNPGIPFTRRLITLPVEVNDQMRDRPDINWSDIAVQAFRIVLELEKEKK